MKICFYIAFWFGHGSAAEPGWFGGSAEPHRTAGFGRTETEPERFGLPLLFSMFNLETF